MIGQTIDRYRIEAQLSQGALGVLYKARDTQLGRVVAIKVFSTKLIAAERRQQFVQEARAASTLNHPNIVSVFDVHSDATVSFITMEHVEGSALNRMMQMEAVGITRAHRYATQIADALSQAHEAGIAG